MTAYLYAGWNVLASPPSSQNAVASIYAGRGACGIIGQGEDDAYGGLILSQDQAWLFMWNNAGLVVYDVKANVWRGPISLPSGCQPSAFSPLYNSRRAMMWDKNTKNLFALDFTARTYRRPFATIQTMDCAIYPSPGGTRYGLPSNPQIWATNKPGIAGMPFNGLFGESLIVFFDYRAATLRPITIVSVTDENIDFHCTQLGAAGANGQTLPGRLYYVAAGAVQSEYRALPQFVPSFGALILPPNNSAWFGDGSGANRAYFSVPQLDGFYGPYGPVDNSMFTDTDTAFESSINGIVGNTSNGCACGGINYSQAGSGAGTVLRSVTNVPFSLVSQSFGLPLTASVPSGFSPRAAWAMFALEGSTAILDDTGAFYLLTLVEWQSQYFNLVNWMRQWGT